MVAPAALAPRHHVRANAPAQLLVQLVLGELATAFQRIARGRGHLLERLGRREAVLGGQALDLPAELRAELAVVAGDQRTPVEGEVPRCQGVDRAAHDVGDDEIARVDRLEVGLAGDAVRACPQREQRRVAGEVRGGAGRRLGEAARIPGRQARAGQPEGEDLFDVDGHADPPTMAPGARSPSRRPRAGSADGRAGGPAAPARTRRCPARRAGRPSAAGGARRAGSAPVERRPQRLQLARATATTFDCGLAAAAICDPRGRVAQYASDSSSDTTLTAPVARIWRWSASHGSTSAARGLASASRPLRDDRFVKSTKPRSSRPLSSTVRAMGAPRRWPSRAPSRWARARPPRPPRRASARPARSRSARGRVLEHGRARVGLAHRSPAPAAPTGDEPREQPLQLAAPGRRTAPCAPARAARPCSTARRASRSARTASRRAIGPADASPAATRGQRGQVRGHRALLEVAARARRAGRSAAAPSPAR